VTSVKHPTPAWTPSRRSGTRAGRRYGARWDTFRRAWTAASSASRSSGRIRGLPQPFQAMPRWIITLAWASDVEQAGLVPWVRAAKGPILLLVWMSSWILVPLLLLAAFGISRLEFLVAGFLILVAPLGWLAVAKAGSRRVRQSGGGGFYVLAGLFATLTIARAAADWSGGVWVIFASLALLSVCAGVGAGKGTVALKTAPRTPPRRTSRPSRR
jgi:hypothetical protein